jgi:hypothetical protein
MIPTMGPTKKNAARTARNHTVTAMISSIPTRSSFIGVAGIEPRRSATVVIPMG